MKNFIFLIITYLSVVTSVHSQERIISPDPQIPYMYRYNVILHIEDSLAIHENGTVELVQKYSLKLGKLNRPNHPFDLDDNVGFRVLLDYDSSITPEEPLRFEIRFLDYVDQSDHFPLEEDPDEETTGDDDPIIGGLKPITIPPVDEEDEEGFPVETDEQQFVFEETGEKKLIFDLFLLNPSGDSPGTKVAEARGVFYVGKTGKPNGVDVNTLLPDNDIAVYPNPIQSDLYISSPNTNRNAKAQISIYTTTGIVLYTSELHIGNQKQNEMSYHFQNPNLSPGVYYYRIQIGDKVYTKPLINK